MIPSQKQSNSMNGHFSNPKVTAYAKEMAEISLSITAGGGGLILSRLAQDPS
jgi:hypothetical protein